MEKKFNLSEFKKVMGLTMSPLKEYDYETYKKVNPNLTVEAYKHLRNNHAEWKILRGKEVIMHCGIVLLEPVW